mgnify:CR=1 FL=1
MKLSDLCRLAGIEYFEEFSDIEISGIVSDSRKAHDGCIYICIQGLSVDGHKFIGSAIRRGASVILCNKSFDARDIPDNIPVIRVENTRDAMARPKNPKWPPPARAISHTTSICVSTSACATRAPSAATSRPA